MKCHLMNKSYLVYVLNSIKGCGIATCKLISILQATTTISLQCLIFIKFFFYFSNDFQQDYRINNLSFRIILSELQII